MQTENFTEIVSHFQPISPQEATELVEKQDGAILFVGRATCCYSRRFAPKLAQVAEEKNWTVYFLNTESPDYPQQEIADFRRTYGIPTVPGFVYAGKDEVKVRCDSSMTPEEIADFVH